MSDESIRYRDTAAIASEDFVDLSAAVYVIPSLWENHTAFEPQLRDLI
jgi:hypothetical protein